MSLVMIIIKGPGIIIDLIVMLLVLIISSLIYFKMSNKALPFSVKFAVADSGKLIGPALVTIMIIGAVAMIHIIVRNDIKAVIILALVLLVVNLILWKIVTKDCPISCNYFTTFFYYQTTICQTKNLTFKNFYYPSPC